jgi:NAD(P)-dependent dehydrogenase (short-subunit alcohol dehydrogenase family)
MIDFTGQVAIVTGAGGGLGRRYALELARRGAAVVVNDVGCTVTGEGSDPAVADKVVAEIQAAGGTAVASHESVASLEGGRAIVALAVETFGRLDAVVSNAGIYGVVPFEELSAEDWHRMLDVHLNGGFYISQPAFSVMKAQGYGRFVFISSSAGVFGLPGNAHYAAAKAGLVGLTNVIAIEGAEHGILANAVLPNGFSRMVTLSVGELEPSDTPTFVDIIDPDLVPPMVVFLASRTCQFTHQNYSAAAGRYARAFIGLGEGWLAEPGAAVTADDIEAHLAKVSATDPYYVPGHLYEEAFEVSRRRGI